MWTSKITMLLCFPLLINIFLSTPCLSSMLCHPDDMAALVQFRNYYAANSSDATSHWKDDTDCCKDWKGFKCDPTTNRIIFVSLFIGGFSGEISPALGDLQYLQHLDFRKQPNLTGPIPVAIAKLKNLDFIRLDWNNLSGPIPSFLSQLKKLSYINLSFNKFSGSIPPSLSLLPNLQAIFASRNQLTGSIPESFGSFKQSNFYLDLSHNNMTGSIPTSLERVEFQSLILSRNHLTGEIRNSSSWSDSDLSRNLLEFNLSKWMIGPGFSSIDFSHNKIYGSIPPMLANFPNLQSINVSYNRLCGPIPTGGRFAVFDQYVYVHNRCLCGKPLPPCK